MIMPANDLHARLSAGIRDAELKQLVWNQIIFRQDYSLTAGKSKTEAGEGSAR